MLIYQRMLYKKNSTKSNFGVSALLINKNKKNIIMRLFSFQNQCRKFHAYLATDDNADKHNFISNILSVLHCKYIYQSSSILQYFAQNQLAAKSIIDLYNSPCNEMFLNYIEHVTNGFYLPTHVISESYV